jgi:hypothetical protein
MAIETVIRSQEQFSTLMKRIENETDTTWSDGKKPTNFARVGEAPFSICLEDSELVWSHLVPDMSMTNDSFVNMLKIYKVVKVSYKVNNIGEFETQKEALEAIENSDFADFALDARFFEHVVQRANDSTCSNCCLSLAIWLRNNKDEVIKFLGKE